MVTDQAAVTPQYAGGRPSRSARVLVLVAGSVFALLAFSLWLAWAALNAGSLPILGQPMVACAIASLTCLLAGAIPRTSDELRMFLLRLSLVLVVLMSIFAILFAWMRL